jgi:transposase-like protein
MTHYTRAFKESLIKKLLLPGGPRAIDLSREMGIPVSTIHTWRNKFAKSKDNAILQTMKKKSHWTPEMKLEAITASLSMSEKELGEYLRKNGLHSSTLLDWKKECLESLKGSGRPKLDPELVAVKKQYLLAEKEILRKDRVLAEMSARIVLIKKTQLLFGEIEDEE